MRHIHICAECGEQWDCERDCALEPLPEGIEGVEEPECNVCEWLGWTRDRV